MINGVLGALPRYQPRPRRTLPYTRKKRRSPKRVQNRAPIDAAVNTQVVLFDHPAPLPVATLRSHSASDFASRLRGTRHAGWRWFRPRAVPAIVAIVGMLAVLGAAEYLTRLARRTPIQQVIAQQVEQVAEAAPSIIVLPMDITVRPRILIDSQPPPAGSVLDAPLGVPLESIGYKIHLIPLK